MLPILSKYENKEVRDLQNKLVTALSLLGRENFRYKIIEGTTTTTADTENRVLHGLNIIPWIVLPLGADIYIYQISDKWVDVRSNILSAEYKIFVMG